MGSRDTDRTSKQDNKMSALKLVLLFPVSILQFMKNQFDPNNARLESYQNIAKAGRKRNGVRYQNKVTYFIHQKQCRFYQRLDKRGKYSQREICCEILNDIHNIPKDTAKLV